MLHRRSPLWLLHLIALPLPTTASLGHPASGQTLGSTSSPSLASFIATQHFQPCYNISSLPSLLDGAVQAARLGSTSFKFALKQDMASMYPYNNEADPWPTNFSTLTEVARSSQVQQLLRNKLNTNFDSFTLWAYRPGAPGSPFCSPTSPVDLAAETAQLAALTEALMALPPSSHGGTTFWLESWENDWATRCGSFSDTPPLRPVVGAYTAWLQARQDGVTQGRAAFCAARNRELAPGQGIPVDCRDPKAVVDAYAVKVFLGAEVNLVGSCLHNVSCGNIVREVLPKVALDYVSYSSYDTMRKPQLADALDLIAAQHNRTAASPQRALFITEFGVPETTTDPKTVRQVVDNVLSIARAKDLARVHYWQTINNEKLGNNGHCIAEDPPNFDPTTQNGFWTTLPNGTLSQVGQYLQDIIAGRQPMPPLVVPLATPMLVV